MAGRAATLSASTRNALLFYRFRRRRLEGNSEPAGGHRHADAGGVVGRIGLRTADTLLGAQNCSYRNDCRIASATRAPIKAGTVMAAPNRK